MPAGWTFGRRHKQSDEGPQEFAEDLVGRVAIVVLAPCVADRERLRLTAHLSGDVAEALPYLNAEMPQGTYVAKLPVFTFMDGHRMVSLFRDRVAVAKADDIVDAWASLERVRCLVNDVWSRPRGNRSLARAEAAPTGLEIYKRLPATNCRDAAKRAAWPSPGPCGAVRRTPKLRLPVFEGDRGDLRDALLSICSGLGLESG